MKAPFSYFGGKTGLAHRIVALMPPHRLYIEPFFGSGAVFFHKQPSRFEILNDIDSRIVTFFRVLRDRPEDLERICALSPHARDEWESAAEPADDDLEIARRLWVRVNQSFAKTLSTATGWSITTARTQSIPATAGSRVGRFAACAARLSEASIENCDAVELLERFGDDPTAVIYTDPPYLGSSRRFGKGASKVDDYAHDMQDPVDHKRLAKVLHQLDATVILSGYHSELYDDLYADWPRVEIPVTAFSSNARTTTRTGRVEILWSNRDSVTRQEVLFDE